MQLPDCKICPKESGSSLANDLFRYRLEILPGLRHELYRLAGLIQWGEFNALSGELYSADNGSPEKATRLIVGLQYLKHVHGLSALVWGIAREATTNG